MRSPRSTIICLAALVSLVLGCDLGPNSIGSLDSDTDTGETGADLDMDQPNTCGQPGVSADFEVVGLEDGENYDFTLVCASSVSEDGEGYSIALTGCTDEQAVAHPGLEILLRGGDWSEPLVDGETALEVRYVDQSMSAVFGGVSYYWGTSRWLLLRKPGGQLPLVAVDAIWTYPVDYSEIEIDYAPLVLDSDSAGCGLIEHPNPKCAAIEPGALIVSVEDQPFAVPEGGQSFEVGGGGADSDSYHVLVERTRSLVDDCMWHPSAEYRFGIAALATD